MVIDVAHANAGAIRMVASPLKIPTAPPVVRLPPPMLGEHTDKILQELLGFNLKTIKDLRNAQVI
jgi:crotonobetainyl-CoA:carnitine CoA-transferase CaiB-like acyl-CoA transferase